MMVMRIFDNGSLVIFCLIFHKSLFPYPCAIICECGQHEIVNMNCTNNISCHGNIYSM